jgi:NAD/NADP transhydrogenase beta subunit
MAKRVEMTKMPELVAFMHSMIGLAAVFIAIAAVVEPQLGIVKHWVIRFRRVTVWNCSSAPPSVPSRSPVR